MNNQITIEMIARAIGPDYLLICFLLFLLGIVNIIQKWRNMMENERK